MFDALLALIAPHRCLSCAAEGSLWCTTCRTGAPTAVSRCYRCHALSDHGRTCTTCRSASPLYGVVAATGYDGIAKRLIWKLKFGRARAADVAAAALIARRCPLPDGALIVPVVTSTSRVRQRGYDQTVPIARELAKQTGTIYCPALWRLGQKQQHTATRRQRLEQLAQAYIVRHPDQIKHKHVVIIDDVITTGATLEAAARALKATGAKRVSAVVFAQA